MAQSINSTIDLAFCSFIVGLALKSLYNKRYEKLDIGWELEPIGPQGPQGETSPPGPAFEPRLYIVESESETNVEGSNFVIVEASCDPGDMLTGGSSRASGSNSAFNLVGNEVIPLDEDTIAVQVTGDTTTAGTVIAQAFAYCMDLTP